MDAVDDDVRHVLDRDARAVGDVDVDAAAVDGLEAVHDELFLQGYDHVALEDDPERLVLDHGVAEGPRGGVDRVVVAGVGDDVVATVAAADRVAAEADRAVGEVLAAEFPFAVAAPAVVDGVAGGAGEVAESSPLCAVTDAHVHHGSYFVWILNRMFMPCFIRPGGIDASEEH